ncbi:nickel ABC transporter, nickel/metallophore periplasmic binding protein [Pseudodesulfovibrio sp. F-1]|uniref:Nickel ABC transporter, nickel/metallophore periplasmic binding protein n=1 Tax=Pseudodesulfovibrio alkaliphilus TaxID=2661613 RepID=A0A7K1KMS7_9BACT|nr:nickel ABC transporter substrate-binding protein [Pseudodesulfovibrio alkaliphilus]MUM77172.1 nickel ABC transporter, nickel/metallophore periplasmic binding protein [Pseudodesulfovibrio alkaliphilus]
MKRAVFYLLSAAVLVASAMLGPVRADLGDTLNYSWAANVGPLNPHAYSPSQMFAQAMVYEPLVRYGEGGGLEPWLAESWDISADGRTYTFHLRKGVTFSDGTPFDAAAAKKNFDAVLLNSQRHNWLEFINQIADTVAVDEHTFQLVLKNAYYPTLQELCLIRPMRFLSPSGFPEDGNTGKGIKAPIGTGPWVLAETRKGEHDLFVANERYWGNKPKFKRLLVKVIPDSDGRAVAFQTGQIDLIFGSGGHGSGQIGIDTFNRFASMPGIETAISAPQATRVLAINSNLFPTSDLAVRQAILYGVNKAAMVKHIFLGVEPMADTLFSPDMPYCDLGLAPFAHDQQKAAALLDEAGWKQEKEAGYRTRDGRELAFDVCFVGNDSLQKSVAEVIQGDLKRLGIRVRLVGEEMDSFLTRQKSGEFGMIFGDTWGAPYDPHSFCSSMRKPAHADYQAQIGLPMKEEIDRKISEVLVSVDEEKRQELYRDILTTLHEQAVYLPLSYMTNITVHRPELKGVTFGPTKYEFPFELMSRER